MGTTRSINKKPREPRQRNPSMAASTTHPQRKPALSQQFPRFFQLFSSLPSSSSCFFRQTRGGRSNAGFPVLSNGRYKSVMHRTTVDKERTRMSWPVFLEPPEEWTVGPLPQLVTEDNPPKYKAKKFKDYAYCKLNKLPQ